MPWIKDRETGERIWFPSGGVSKKTVEEMIEQSGIGGGNGSGGGMSATAINLLIEVLESAVYSTNVSGKIASLKEALLAGGSGGGDTGGGDMPDNPVEPDEPVVPDDITVSGGVMTIISVGSEIAVSGGVMTIA